MTWLTFGGGEGERYIKGRKGNHYKNEFPRKSEPHLPKGKGNPKKRNDHSLRKKKEKGHPEKKKEKKNSIRKTSSWEMPLIVSKREGAQPTNEKKRSYCILKKKKNGEKRIALNAILKTTFRPIILWGGGLRVGGKKERACLLKEKKLLHEKKRGATTLRKKPEEISCKRGKRSPYERGEGKNNRGRGGKDGSQALNCWREKGNLITGKALKEQTTLPWKSRPKKEKKAGTAYENRQKD